MAAGVFHMWKSVGVLFGRERYETAPFGDTAE
jgi:hypothetical protein